MIDKPKLTVAEQIEHLKQKGVRFSIVTEDKALEYLSKNNNYFKLTAYRKNYAKNQEDKYVGLEFAHLQDLAIIDMHIRYCLLPMCLDIEHNVRVQLIKTIEESEEDGYEVVNDYKQKFKDVNCEIEQAQHSPYCKDIVTKYGERLPVWAFVEIVQFKQLINFYKFVGERLSNRKMVGEYYFLQEIRHIRNACAHSNCILNDLKSQKTSQRRQSTELCLALSHIGISKGVRARKLSNDRIRQITTLLYFYKDFLKSSGLRKDRTKQMHEIFINRAYRHIEYYKNVDQVLTTFDFFDVLLTIGIPWIIMTLLCKSRKTFTGRRHWRRPCFLSTGLFLHPGPSLPHRHAYTPSRTCHKISSCALQPEDPPWRISRPS